MPGSARHGCRVLGTRRSATGAPGDDGSAVRRLASILGAFLLVVPMAAWAPPARTSGGGPLGQGNGYLNQRWWQHRQDGYLDYATQLLDRTSPTNVLAFAARAARD